MHMVPLTPPISDGSLTGAEEKLIAAYEASNAIMQEHLNAEKRLENHTINTLGVIGIISGVVACVLFKNDIDMPSTKYATSVLGFGLTGLAGIGKLMK